MSLLLVSINTSDGTSSQLPTHLSLTYTPGANHPLFTKRVHVMLYNGFIVVSWGPNAIYEGATSKAVFVDYMVQRGFRLISEDNQNPVEQNLEFVNTNTDI